MLHLTRVQCRLALALACIATLAGCSGRSGAEAAVRDSLKDPDSAKFGDFYYNAKTKKGCLTVNARNSMGGYTGDQQAYVELKKDWEVMGIGDLTPASCKEIHADQPMADNGNAADSAN